MLCGFSGVLPQPLGGGILVCADSNGELHIIGVAEPIQPAQEVLYRLQILVARDLAQVVHEYMGNIVIAGVQAADKAPQALVIIHMVLTGVDQTDIIADGRIAQPHADFG